ncbi:MAG TPA: hypothetical protein PL173_13060 [Saprospiraceae bacterium]|nr:hypothetical protein [Saprospiraceae bacterium]HMX02903.1 hypothetical protein [Cyclobacteriaceae bacterium]HNG14008.1 hypothetical protein [Saprospiraceae bacterium]HNI55119.1 hypothetical protein [Chitinophagales bacterium]
MDQYSAPFQDKYKKPKFGRPIDTKNPDKVTDKTWFIRKAEWIYSMWLTDQSYIPYSNALEYTTLRLYSQGRQPTTKYMNILDPQDPTTGERLGLYNISWDNVAVYPKYRDRMRGALSRIDFSTNAQALDDNSVMDRNMLKMRSWVMEKEKEWIEAVNQAAGIEEDGTVPQENLPMRPRSLQEMEMMESMGCYRIPLEASIEKLLYKSARLSEWDEIKLRLEEDFIDLGIAAVQDFTDPISRVPKMRYVDPAYLIIAHYRDNAYTEIADCAEVRFLTMAELKDMGASEDDMKAAALAYQNVWNNPGFNQVWYNNSWNYQLMSLYKVAILDMDFSSWNTEYYEFRALASTGQEKGFRVDEKEYGSRKNRKYNQKNYERRYQGKWIIGTNIMLPGYGYQYDQVFDYESRPKCSYSVYRTGQRSVTSRCVSTIDDMQLAVLKFRNAWAKAAPAGILIEWGSLTEMVHAGRKLKPLDMIKMWRNTGDLLYKGPKTPDGRTLQGTNPPIMPLTNGIGNMMAEFADSWNIYNQTLAELTAIGRGQDGTMPAPDTLVGVANIAEAATQDTFRPIIMGYKRLKSRVNNNVALRWQLRSCEGDVDEYVEKREGAAGEIVRLSYDDIRGRIIQINCESIIDDSQKQQVLVAADRSLQAAKAGQVGISMADFLIIMQAIERGQVKYALMWLHYREEQMKAEQIQREQMNQQANTEGAIALKQADQQNLQAELAMKKQLSAQEGANKIQEIQEKGKQDRETLLLKFQLERGVMPSSLGVPSLPTLSDSPAPSPVVEPAPAATPSEPMPSQPQAQALSEIGL